MIRAKPESGNRGPLPKGSHALGFWSSHPDALKERWRWMWWLTAIPMLIALALFITFFFFSAQWIGWLRQIPLLLRLILVVGGFVISFGLTFSLCSALALRQIRAGGSHPSEYRAGGLDRLQQKNLIFVIGAVVLATLIPGLVVTSSKVAFSTRVLTYLFVSLPLITMIALAFPRGNPRQPRYARWIGSLISILELSLLVLSLAAVLTIAQDVARINQIDWLQQTLAPLLPGYDSLENVFTGLIVLGPVIYTCLVFRARMRQILSGPFEFEDSFTDNSPHSSPADHLAPEIAGNPDGILTRLLKRWFGGRKVDPDPRPSEIPAEELQQQIADALGLDLAKAKTLPESVAQFVQQDSFLFGGHLPTGEQSNALKNFREMYLEANQSTRKEPQDRNIDLLIHGPPMSGKTTVLIACLMEAVAGRGEYCIVLAPDTQTMEALQDRIRQQVRFLDLAHLITVEILDRKWVDGWDSPEPFIPQILLATPSTLQSLFYENDSAKQVVKLFAAFFVEDYQQFGHIERSHLSFLIDKQRWIIESQHLVFQAIVTCGSLSESGVYVVLDRLATSTPKSEQVVSLRPLSQRSAKLLVATGDFGPIRQSLAPLSESHPGKFLFKRRDDQGRLQNLEKPVGAVKSISPSVHAEIDRRFPVVICEGVLTERELSGIRRECLSDGGLIVAGGFRRATPIVPIVANRDSPSFRAVHFQNLMNLLDLDTPVHVDVAKRFGIMPSADSIKKNRLSEPASPPVLYWDFLLPFPQDDERFSFCSVRNASEIRQPIDCQAFPNPDFGLLFDQERNQIAVQRLSQADEHQVDLKRRRAIWKNDAGQNLDVCFDLAHSRQLHVKTSEGNVLIPTNIVSKDADGFVINARKVRVVDRDERPTIPQYRLNWSLGEATDPITLVKPVILSPQKEPARVFDAYFFADLELSRQEFLRLDCSIKALVANNGAQVGLDGIDFSLIVNHALWIVNPQGSRGLSTEQLALIQKTIWSTDDPAFRPALSLALATSVEECLPGFITFGWPLVFQSPWATSQYFVWIVQPATGGWTASKAIRNILSSLEDRKNLMNHWIEKLESVSSPADAKKQFRNQAGIDFYSGHPAGDADSEIGNFLSDLGIAK